MAINNSSKSAILIKRFESLKDDYLEHNDSLKEIIVSLFEVDEEVALNMWEYLLMRNNGFLKDRKTSFSLCSHPFGDILESKGITYCTELLRKDDFLRESLLLYNGNPTYAINDVLIYLADIKDFSFLSELLGLIGQNRYWEQFFFKEALLGILSARGLNYQVANEESYYSQDLINLLYSFSHQRLNDKEKSVFIIELLYHLEIDLPC